MSVNYFPEENEIRCPKCNAIATSEEETHCAICHTSLEPSPQNKSKVTAKGTGGIASPVSFGDNGRTQSVPVFQRMTSKGIEAVFNRLNFKCLNCGKVGNLGANICLSCGHSLKSNKNESESLEERQSKVISILERISHKKPKIERKSPKSRNKQPSTSTLKNKQSRKSRSSTKSSSVLKKIWDYFSFNKKMWISCGISTILASSILISLDKRNSVDNFSLSNNIVETKTLIYGGSSCLVSLFKQDIESAIEAQNPQYNFEYQSPSSRKNPYPCSFNIDPLLEEEVDFIISNRHVSIRERFVAEKKGIELGSAPFAIDGLLPVINPNQNLGHLSIPQLRAIFAGIFTNWNEIGGANLPITLVILESVDNPDLELLMVGSDYHPSEDVIIVPDYTSGIQKVAVTPGAIFLAPLSVVQNQEKVTPLAVSQQDNSAPIAALIGDRSINVEAFTQHQYPLRRSLFLVYSEKVVSTVRDEAKIYLDFLASEEGRQLLEKNGLIPAFYSSN